jgi:hypothetical protein
MFVRDKPIFSSERMLHKNYARKSSVENISVRESQGAWRQDELIGGKRQSCGNFDVDFGLSSVVRRWLAGNGVSAQAEESPLLEAVTRKRLVESVID